MVQRHRLDKHSPIPPEKINLKRLMNANVSEPCTAAVSGK
jgi:hypothetical protein